ncbi:unnamed protein product [Vicia faba]|uniref:Uncharacterized protein n=1 Tax=Vicia faba TaxID=3906 RepID=A0AAV0YR80_VICFA|nr:unnamed protein product [Vicia faba]
MLVYDPKQNPGTGAGTNAFDEILKATPPALVAFLANLPTVYGPTPNVDIVLSICLHNDLPMGQSGKIGIQSQLPGGPAPATSELSGSNHYGKRKELDRQEDDDATSLQSQPPPRDAFRIRHTSR